MKRSYATALVISLAVVAGSGEAFADACSGRDHTTGTLAGSPADDIAQSFYWVILPIVAVPWPYAFRTYIYNPKKPHPPIPTPAT